MPGGIPFDDIARQAEGIQMVSAHNQQQANRLGHGRSNESKIIEREARRRARQYEIAEIGLAAYWKKRLGRKS
ncbi:MAG: hypothetical protein E7458_04200 [Ruminococcaceae bacterium]|nr:hypothetical protein [Oscillospiraceae bacterium]